MTSLFLLFSFGIFCTKSGQNQLCIPRFYSVGHSGFDGFFRYKIHENENSWRHQREKMATMGERIP